MSARSPLWLPKLKWKLPYNVAFVNFAVESEGDWTRLWQRAAALMGQPCDNQNREIHYDRFVIKIRGHL